MSPFSLVAGALVSRVDSATWCRQAVGPPCRRRLGLPWSSLQPSSSRLLPSRGSLHTAYLSFRVTDWRSELVFPHFQIPERKLWSTWLVDLPYPISSDWGWAVIEKTGLASLTGWAGSVLRGSVALGQADVQRRSPVVRLQQISSGRLAFGPLNSPASSQGGSQL